MLVDLLVFIDMLLLLYCILDNRLLYFCHFTRPFIAILGVVDEVLALWLPITLNDDLFCEL